MHIVVCVKQIPDPTTPGRLDPGSRSLVREGRPILDDADAYGVETGLQLVERSGSGEVTLVSMAPGGEVAGLKTALAMGAARAVVVSDDRLAGADALSTAKVLAAAISGQEADLVLAATESTDGYTGTLPVQLAELLGWPSITFAKRVAVEGTSVVAQRQTDDGYEDVRCPLPAVVTVTAGVVEPRYPSFKGIMAAKTRPVAQLSLDDLGLGDLPGWGQEVVDVVEAERRQAGEVVEDDGTGHVRILEYLERIKVL